MRANRKRRPIAAWLAISLVVAIGCGDSNGGSNQSPVAEAGADREVVAGSVVTLDASLSSDPDGDAISYLWTLTVRPEGSEAQLSDSLAPQPTFIADREGVYRLDLVVSDGKAQSSADAVVVTATHANARPIAVAGVDQTVALGSVVTLDASSSNDADGDQLSLIWTFNAKPAESSAGIKDATAVRTVFVADVVGEFRVGLVVSDGEATSESDEVVFTVVDTNVPPIADAGADRTVEVGTVVDIDGRRSTDADGDSLGYRWGFVSKPAGSNAGIKDSTRAQTLFVADVEGQFVLQLVVDDGRASSAADVLVVTATRGNRTPVAVAGADQSVRVGDAVTLDGGASSDPDGSALAYAWSFVSRPDGSAATLDAPTGASSGFVADVVGQYVVRLVVSDGLIESREDTVLVTASEDGGGGVGSDGCSDPGTTVLCDSLDGSTRGNAKGGQFLSGGGWQPGWNIIWDLGRTLNEGSFSADLANWDTSTSSPQHQHSKQHILNMFQESHGSVHTADENGTGFWNVRTGRDYNGLFKFLSSTRGFGERVETRLSPPDGRLDPRMTHTVRVEFDRAGNATVFLDGRSLVSQPHPRAFQLRYVIVGTDNSPGDTYGPQAGVIYSNIKVWGSTAGGRMLALELSTADGKPVVREVAMPRVGRGLLDWLRHRATSLAVAQVLPRG